MTQHNDELQEALQRITGTPLPTSKERQAALARLHQTIRDEAAPSSRRLRKLVPAAAVLSVVLVVLVTLVTLVTLRTPRATAALSELAEATRRVDQITLAPGQAIHTTAQTTQLTIIPGEEVGLEAEAVAYLLPSTQDTWHQEDGSVIVRTTIGTPVFFDQTVEQAYYQAGYDTIDLVGETYEDAFTGVTNPTGENDWPTNPESLNQAMTAWVRQGGSQLPEDVQLFQLAGSILRAQPTPPALRAGILEVLATLNLTTTADSAARTLTVTITYQDGETTLTEHLTFDSSGHLIADGTTTNTAIEELGIPANTTIAEGHYTVPVNATGDDSRP